MENKIFGKIKCALGRQPDLKSKLHYTPAIDLIKTQRNNSTYVTAMVNLPSKHYHNKVLKKKVTELFNGSEPLYFLIGDVFTMSPFLNFSFDVEVYACHGATLQMDPETKDNLRMATKVFEMVTNEPFVCLKILRLNEAPEKIEWKPNNVRSLGLDPDYLLSLNKANTIQPKKLKALRKDVVDMMKENIFFRDDAKERVTSILQKYAIRNAGIIKHRILEAGRTHVKSPSFMQMATLFLPKYMKFLFDNRRVIDKCLDYLKQSDTPDMVLYEMFPEIWTKLPWVDQVEDTLRYWLKYKLFEVDPWDRFEAYKKVYDQRQRCGDTMACLKVDLKLEHNGVSTIRRIFDPDQKSTYNYAFEHEYQKEKFFIKIVKKALERHSFLQGYQLDIDLSGCVFVVSNMQMKRYCRYLISCSPQAYASTFDTKNIIVYDRKMTGPAFGLHSYGKVVILGIDIWNFDALKDYVTFLDIRTPKSKMLFHSFGNLNLSQYCAPRYGLRPFMLQLQKEAWMPSADIDLLTPPQERMIEDVDAFVAEIKQQDKRRWFCGWESPVFMTFSKDDHQAMVEELSTNARFPRDMHKFKVGDRVLTPDGFLTQITRISKHGNASSFAWKDNYEDFLIFLKVPFSAAENNCASLSYHPRQLRDAFVMRFHWVTGFLNKVVLCGTWPKYAVDEIRKMVVSVIALHPNFTEQPWSAKEDNRKACFRSILHEMEMDRQQRHQDRLLAEQRAKQEQKKRKLQEIAKIARKRAKARSDASLSSETLQDLQEAPSPDALPDALEAQKKAGDAKVLPVPEALHAAEQGPRVPEALGVLEARE